MRKIKEFFIMLILMTITSLILFSCDSNEVTGSDSLFCFIKSSPEILDDLDLIRQAMIGAAIEAGATIVGETFHKFSPVGVTGVVAIARGTEAL